MLKPNRAAGPIMLLANISPAAAQWCFVWLIAQFSGPSAVGQYSLALAMTTPIFIAAELSLRTIYISLRQELTFGNFWWLRVSALFAAVVMTYVIYQVSRPVNPAILFWVVAVKVLDSLSDMGYAVLQRQQRFAQLFAGVVTNAVLTVLLGSALLLAQRPVPWALAASAGASGAICLILVIRVLLYENFVASMTGLRTVLAASLPAGTAQFITAILAYLPVLFLAASGDHAAVGVFTAVLYFVTATTLAISSIAQAALPSLAAVVRSVGVPAGVQRAKPWLRTMALIGLTTALVVAAGGSKLITTIYGPEFRVDPAVLWLIIVTILLAPFAQFAGLVLVLANRFLHQMLTAICGLAVATLTGAAVLAIHGNVSIASAALILAASVLARAITGTAFAHQRSLLN